MSEEISYGLELIFFRIFSSCIRRLYEAVIGLLILRSPLTKPAEKYRRRLHSWGDWFSDWRACRASYRFWGFRMREGAQG